MCCIWFVNRWGNTYPILTNRTGQRAPHKAVMTQWKFGSKRSIVGGTTSGHSPLSRNHSVNPAMFSRPGLFEVCTKHHSLFPNFSRRFIKLSLEIIKTLGWGLLKGVGYVLWKRRSLNHFTYVKSNLSPNIQYFSVDTGSKARLVGLADFRASQKV